MFVDLGSRKSIMAMFKESSNVHLGSGLEIIPNAEHNAKTQVCIAWPKEAGKERLIGTSALN